MTQKVADVPVMEKETKKPRAYMAQVSKAVVAAGNKDPNKRIMVQCNPILRGFVIEHGKVYKEFIRVESSTQSNIEEMRTDPRKHVFTPESKPVTKTYPATKDLIKEITQAAEEDAFLKMHQVTVSFIEVAA